MSFLDKARQAAEQARASANQTISAMTTPEAKAEMRETASQMGLQVRDAASQAKRGLVTAIERIDPAIVADIVIKATAIQEVANRSLRDKGSPYRIAEITITATIPPQIGFSIARVGEEAEAGVTTVSSQDLVAGDASLDAVVTLEGEILEAVAAEPDPT
jgi:hypothetical protein